MDSSIPFFSDEVAGMILEQEKLKYTLKEVISYVDIVRSKSEKLTCRDYEIKTFTEYYETR